MIGDFVGVGDYLLQTLFWLQWLNWENSDETDCVSIGLKSINMSDRVPHTIIVGQAVPVIRIST